MSGVVHGACQDCARRVEEGEMFACDTECRALVLCGDCYEENHAEGGCGADLEPALEVEAPDAMDAEVDLRRLESLLTTGGAKAFYDAIREMGRGRKCPDTQGVDY